MLQRGNKVINLTDKSQQQQQQQQKQQQQATTITYNRKLGSSLKQKGKDSAVRPAPGQMGTKPRKQKDSFKYISMYDN